VNRALNYELTFIVLTLWIVQLHIAYTHKLQEQKTRRAETQGLPACLPTCYGGNPTSYQDHKHKTIILSPHVNRSSCSTLVQHSFTHSHAFYTHFYIDFNYKHQSPTAPSNTLSSYCSLQSLKVVPMRKVLVSVRVSNCGKVRYCVKL
jgi:hypothetical protein